MTLTSVSSSIKSGKSGSTSTKRDLQAIRNFLSSALMGYGKVIMTISLPMEHFIVQEETGSTVTSIVAGRGTPFVMVASSTFAVNPVTTVPEPCI